MGDVIFKTEDGWFIFQMLTNSKYEYRFSIKNKFFWEINRETGERNKRDTNWIGIFKTSKSFLDKFNGKYNKFHLMADYIDFEGSGKGIYGVTLNSLTQLLEYN